MRKRALGFKFIGIVLMWLGAVILLNAFLGTTGMAILSGDFLKSSGFFDFGFVIGVAFVVGGFVLFVVAEKTRASEKESDLEESIKEAIESQGIPKDEAKELFDELNKKVESGEWVELKKITVRNTNRDKKDDWGYGTSLCRYWGPAKYKGSSGKALDRYYDRGEIGKTHEVVRGSDKWKEHGRYSRGEVSLPGPGSRVLHRHWEISQIYKKRREYQEANG